MSAALSLVRDVPEMAPAARIEHVIQGEFRVSNEAGLVLTTVLGSCVAACLRDPVAGVGGMNHFLLPGGGGASDAQEMRYGVHAMELLVNELLMRGARRRNLEAKLFGGGRVTPGLTDIGRLNADFAEWFLKQENIPLVGGSLRGDRGRRVRFSPTTGEARQLWLAGGVEKLIRTERRVPAIPETAGTVELF